MFRVSQKHAGLFSPIQKGRLASSRVPSVPPSSDFSDGMSVVSGSDDENSAPTTPMPNWYIPVRTPGIPDLDEENRSFSPERMPLTPYESTTPTFFSPDFIVRTPGLPEDASLAEETQSQSNASIRRSFAFFPLSTAEDSASLHSGLGSPTGSS